MSQSESLLELLAETNRLSEALVAHLRRWPSARLSHYAPRTYEIASAIQATSHDVERAAQVEAERDARREARANERKYDKHTLEMAEKLKITPDAFLELQDQRRAEMATARAKPTVVI